jgi:hypothetical protein
MRHGPREAVGRAEIRHHEIERRRDACALHQRGNVARHVVERQGKVVRRRRAAQSRQVRRVAVILSLHTLHNRQPHVSRIGHAVQEEDRLACANLDEIGIGSFDG